MTAVTLAATTQSALAYSPTHSYRLAGECVVVR